MSKIDSFFYYCEKFEKNISGKSYEDKVRKKLEEIEKWRNLTDSNTLVRCGKVFYLKTQNIARTIIQPYPIDEPTQVYFVRDVIDENIWSRTAYQQVKSDSWLSLYPLSDSDLKAAQEELEQRESVINSLQKPPVPPNSLVKWHKDFKLRLGLDIYETEAWVNYAMNPIEKIGLREKDIALFRNLLKTLTNNLDSAKLIPIEGSTNLFQTSQNEITVLVSIHNLNGKKCYLLHGGANTEIQRDYWNEIYKEISQKAVPQNKEEIARSALRAYPSYTLKQQELWDNIQRSAENSNFSLLEEQINFLQNVRLPTYINGQAGSGKSTMLYYLFANAFYLKAHGSIKGDILFLTENETLLETTKRAIRDLLTNNPEFGLEAQLHFSDFDKCFSSFHSFLLNVLPEANQREFEKDKYLNFSKFKHLYQGSNIEKHIIQKYSAEEVWFVVTAYIRGYDERSDVSATEYESKIKSKSRILPKSTIKEIEEKIYQPFYVKKLDEGYWDKIKLIRYIKETLKKRKKYAAIICDEAQDFSRVELRFILQSCELIDYDLSTIEQVPIIFAGDPNQTVNPTGFRIDMMTALIYQELKEIAKFKLGLNKEYHQYNYRSSQYVVELANLIQFYRKKHLNNTIKKPQKVKSLLLDNPHQNVFIPFEKLKNDNELLHKLQYKAFIHPLDGDEEGETIPFHLVEAIENLDTKTSVEAKGSEYSQVVLFGFGNYFLQNENKLGQLFIKKNDSCYFAQRYFFNKLYVAITRAKEELVIIDSIEAKEKFWKEIINSTIIENENWKLTLPIEDLILYDAGTFNISQSTQKEGLENAYRDKEQALIEKSPDRLKLVAKQFFRYGEYEEQYFCLAKAAEFLQKWKIAAENYLRAGQIELSSQCYWKGEFFEKLQTQFINKPKHEKQVLREKLAALLNQPTDIEALVNEVYRIKHLLRNIVEDLPWRSEFIDKTIQLYPSIKTTQSLREYADILEEFVEDNDTELFEAIGDIRYKIKDFERAISSWDTIDLQHDNYIEAKINSNRSQGNQLEEVIWLNKKANTIVNESEISSVYNQILEIHRTAMSRKLEIDHYFAIYEAALYVLDTENELLDIAKITEEKSNNLYQLLLFYEYLLDKPIKNELAPFLIERWAKAYYHSNKENNNWISHLNQEYKNINEKYNIPFELFTEEELVQIEEVPQSIVQVPPAHFQNIIIHDFRQFASLEIQNIGQFNIIVGDNNTGKTSLLEALLFTPDELEFSKYLVYAYKERSRNRKVEENFWQQFVAHEATEKKIHYELVGNRRKWDYLYPKDDIPHEKLKKLTEADAMQSPLVPFGKGYDASLPEVYHETIGKKRTLRGQFEKNLKAFIPNIDNVISGDNSILIEEKDMEQEEGFPLYQYGEGANKLFRILTQMTLQQNKKILIDEIDSGIHFNRFPEFWRVILEIAHSNNIQIFATTHNIECIHYFAEVLKLDEMKEYQSEARTITLYRTAGGQIKTRTRTFEAFQEAIEDGHNIRGGE